MALHESCVTQDKSVYADMLRNADRLLGRRISGHGLRHLACTAEEAPDTFFANELIVFMVKTFVERGDRESLVKLLSARCPDHVDMWTTIEAYVVCRGKELTDPVVVFGDAYEQCETPDTRRKLAATIRRAFADLGIKGTDDAEYVKNAMQWYEQQKDHLAVNWGYRDNDRLFPPESYEKHPELYEKVPAYLKREPLFKWNRRSPR